MSALGAGLGAGCSPAAPKSWRIGYLNLRGELSAQDEGFVRTLHDLGYVEGRNLAIEYRWAAGDRRVLPVLAEELVRLKVESAIGSRGTRLDLTRPPQRRWESKVPGPASCRSHSDGQRAGAIVTSSCEHPI
jgi:hypothetical protein